MEKIAIFDFGSQFTQLISRRLREMNYCSVIYPFNKSIDVLDDSVKGVILSGSPFSVRNENRLNFPVKELSKKYPILGICYGAQYLTYSLGGEVKSSNKREYGHAEINIQADCLLTKGLTNKQVWMSHSDTINRLPKDFTVVANTKDIPVAAFEYTHNEHPIYGIQFHPEVSHTIDGELILKNFADSICHCKPEWQANRFSDDMIASLKKQIGEEKVILGLSGGVDSSVAALLIHKAIGNRMTGIFINNGLLRQDEYNEVLDSYKDMGLNVKGIDASDAFLNELKGVSDPEQKRKIIGRVFIEVFEKEAKKIEGVSFLAQGTIYPDVIESVSVFGPSVTIKSHHNVGGLPEKMGLKLVEPLRMLFKDEVRKVGAYLGLKNSILQRHPFPGPGLAIRILGDITPEKIALNQAADHIFIQTLKEEGWYEKVWQAGTILLPVKSVGVMGDERTYEFTIALRAVESIDGMTATWAELPYKLLAKVSNEIINQVKGINRVVYDISTKPPATIEWE